MENEFEKNEFENTVPEEPEIVNHEPVGGAPVEGPIEEAAEKADEKAFTPPYFNNLNRAPGSANTPSYAPRTGEYRPVNGAPANQPVPQPYGGANYGVPDVNEGRISYAPAQPTHQAGQKKHKQKKRGGRGWIAVVVAVCVLLSFGAGFLGAYVAGVTGTVRTSEGTETENDGSQSTVIRQVEPTDVSDKKPSAGSSVYADVVSSVADSVVEVYTEYTTMGWFRYIVSGGGSGVVISEDGYIVTNNHVVTAEDDETLADSVKVRMRNGDEYPATVVGGDPDADIAVIKIEAEGLVPATFGDSDALAVGDEVIAIGNPLGELGGTVTNGIISSLAREISVEGNDMTLLQTNTAINPGNSGGGLFNLKGELIGIVNAVSDSSVEGIAFAIPGNEALATAKDIMENGSPSSNRTIIGVTLFNVDTAGKAAQFGVNSLGVYIFEVTKGYNDDVLKEKDRILAVDGVEISSGDDAIKEIRKHSPGDTIELTLFRDGDVMKVEVSCFESGDEE
ncbi:MAG: trypsin-like peptidase domain-containing protein [Clostridia bacterium]|nr:trypsin-like peptidase domain-containing protein [Clostridia bacterium]MBR7034116.1 trypsin-like peptidase domain-containing protein [Clostridia bacterium]